MPKVGVMAQLSRPFQIALAALALFAIVWLLALRGHSGATSEPGSPAAPSKSSASAPSSVYHGSAPGVEGLTRDLAKAHGAATTSEQNAKKLAEQSAQASGGTASVTPTSTSTAPNASAPAASVPSAASKPATVHRATGTTTHAPAAKPTHSGTHAPAPAVKPPAMQAKVEAELKQGKVVTILFWNPKAVDDVAVHGQLRSVGGKLGGAIAVHDVLAGQVASFGSIIRGVQVFGTPTILLINQHGLAQTLTGYTDAYSIEQAITEVRHA
jgi:hypothetical protein